MSYGANRVDVTSEGVDVIIVPMISPYRATDDFLDDCRRRGYSERTLTTYQRLLYQFGDRLPIDYDVGQITIDDVRRYLAFNRAKLSQGTIAHRESVVASWLKWLYKNRKIKTNPMDRLERTKRIPAADLDVTTVSTDDVRKLVEAAATDDALLSARLGRPVWTSRLTIAVLIYTGARRRAVARLRYRDYDRKGARIRFREKGAKTIWKPVPDELRALVEAAVADGALGKPTDFLIPPAPGGFLPPKVLDGSEERDDRCIWRTVKDVGARAGVKTHVHALRAAFAVFYLEQNTGDVEALRELMGHRDLKTTQGYLRQLDRVAAMERVRGLSWGGEATPA